MSNTLTDAASIAIASGAFLSGVSWLSVKVWKMLKRLARFLDDYEGTPARPGVEARPGVMERIQGMEHLLGAIHYELPRNGVPLSQKVDELWQWKKAQDAA